MSSITEDTILRMLRRKLYSNEVTVLGWQMATESQGVNSATVRFRVEYQFGGDRSQEWFFAKLPIRGKTYEFSRAVGVLENELVTYELILPHLGRMRTFAPQLFYSSKGDYSLVLQDLISEGYRSHPPQHRFELQPALRILRQLAQFHAASVQVRRIRPDVYDWLNCKYLTDHPSKTAGNAEKLANLLTGLVRRLDADFAAENAEKLRDLAENLMPSSFSHRMCDQSAFNVFNHGDFWTTNIMLKYDRGIEEVRFVDFQYASWNLPAFDVFPFLMTSVKFDVFEQHADQLYGGYVDSLNEALREFGISRSYTIEELVADIERKYSCWLYFIVVRMAAMFCDPHQFDYKMLLEGRYLEEEWFRRVADRWVAYFIRKSIKSPERGILSKWYR